MPNYFFHIRDSAGVIADDEGMALADLPAARAEAKISAMEIYARRISANQNTNGLAIVIAGHDGEVLDSVLAQACAQ